MKVIHLTDTEAKDLVSLLGSYAKAVSTNDISHLSFGMTEHVEHNSDGVAPFNFTTATNLVNFASYLAANFDEAPTYTKKFIDIDTVAFRVKNIRFTNSDGSPVRIQRIDLEESAAAAEMPDASPSYCYKAHARAVMFYNACLDYDVEELELGEYVAKRDIIDFNNTECTYEPFYAEDAENAKFSVTDYTGDDAYNLTYPDSWICVLTDMPVYLIQSTLGKDSKAYKDIIDQFVFEYLLSTLPVSVD